MISLGFVMVAIQVFLLVFSWDGIKNPARASFMHGIVVGIGIYAFGLLWLK